MCSSTRSSLSGCLLLRDGGGESGPKGHTNCVFLSRPGEGILSKEQAFGRMIS